MLQRIQSVYLFLASALMVLAITMSSSYFYFEFTKGDEIAFFGAFGFYDRGEYLTHAWGVLVIGLLTVLLLFIDIFLYKNRKKQITLCKISVFLIILFYITAGVYAYTGMSKLGLTFSSLNFTIFLPLISLIFSVMALLKIKSDEKLVRSLDRIR